MQNIKGKIKQMSMTKKTMGVITALLIAGGYQESKEFVVPLWVIVSSAAAAAIGLGTFFGDGEL